MTNGTQRLDRMVAGKHVASPCGESMSLPVVSEYSSGYVKCLKVIEPRFMNSSGAVFGGYLAALLDDVTGHTAMTVIPDDKISATADISVSFFRPCTPSDGELILEGFLINQSRRSFHIEGTIKKKDGKLIAKAHAIYAISDRR